MSEDQNRIKSKTEFDLIPLTPTEVSLVKRKALQISNFALAIAIASITCAVLFPNWSGCLSFIAALASIYLFMFWCTEGGDALKLGVPLPHRASIRLLRLAHGHPEIARLVELVHESGRPVSWGDLWRANAWLNSKTLTEQKRSLRRLN